MLHQIAVAQADRDTPCRMGPSVLAGRELTPREQEVWALMAAGRTDAEIAEQLALNSLTVRFHLTNAFAKLGAASPVEAAVLVRRSHTAPGGDSENAPLHG